MQLKLYIKILLIFLITSCTQDIDNKGDSSHIAIDEKKVNNSVSSIQNQKIVQVDTIVKIELHKHPKLNKDYKFLGLKDSVHYVLILKRTNDTTLVFRTNNDKNGTEMHYGTAFLNKTIKAKIEKSAVTGNEYKANEFVEVMNNMSYKIRIGIDSIGSGDRLLVRFIETKDDKVTTDLNMAN